MSTFNDTLLKLIPESQLKSHLIVKWKDGGICPLHALRRYPVSIDEFREYRSLVIVWMENGIAVMIRSTPSDADRSLRNRNTPHLQLIFDHDNLEDTITCTGRGPSNTTIAETAAFLWGLKHEEQKKV